VPKYLRRLDLSIEIVERVAADVRRWRAHPQAVEKGAQLRGWHPEIVHRAEELDVLVADLRNVAKCSLEILARVVTQSVELNPDAAQAAPRRHAGNSRRTGEMRRGCREAERRQKCPAVHVILRGFPIGKCGAPSAGLPGKGYCLSGVLRTDALAGRITIRETP